MSTIFPVTDPKYQRIFAEEASIVDASELIADALSHSGMTRTDLANALNVSKSEITARLQGKRNLTLRSLAATLNALGVQLCLQTSNRGESTVPIADAVPAYISERRRVGIPTKWEDVMDRDESRSESSCGIRGAGISRVASFGY